jgi:hypothetical protein
MSAELVSVEGDTVTVRFAGKLTQPELASVQSQVAEILNQQPRTRILAIAENFEGWERAGAWGDISFQVKHDHKIERMAIVCDEKWESLALLFTSRGFRKFPIEYFPLSQIDNARAWLATDLPGSTTNP